MRKHLNALKYAPLALIAAVAPAMAAPGDTVADIISDLTTEIVFTGIMPFLVSTALVAIGVTVLWTTLGLGKTGIKKVK